MRYSDVHAGDEEIVEGLRGRRPAAFDAAYARYEKRVYRFLLRMSGAKAVAEDLHQETWILVARRASDLEPDSDLAAWVFTIARNRYRSWRRWAMLDFTRLVELAREPSLGPAAPDREIEARARAEAVERALERISAPHREVLLLAVVEELPAASVAAILGLTAEAVRQRLHRARAELRGAIEREEAGRAARDKTKEAR